MCAPRVETQHSLGADGLQRALLMESRQPNAVAGATAARPRLGADRSAQRKDRRRRLRRLPRIGYFLFSAALDGAVAQT